MLHSLNLVDPLTLLRRSRHIHRSLECVGCYWCYPSDWAQACALIERGECVKEACRFPLGILYVVPLIGTSYLMDNEGDGSKEIQEVRWGKAWYLWIQFVNERCFTSEVDEGERPSATPGCDSGYTFTSLWGNGCWRRSLVNSVCWAPMVVSGRLMLNPERCWVFTVWGRFTDSPIW